MQTYGGGHADMDLKDHFDQGMALGGEGGRAHKDLFGGKQGAGHEDKDTKDNFAFTGQAEIGMQDQAGDGNMFGGHQGNAGHKDTFDHFGEGTEVSGDASRKFVEQKYGGDHEDKDTYSHFQNMAEVGDEGSSKGVMGDQHYGGGHENKDTFSHLGAGLIPNAQPTVRKFVDVNGPTPGARPKQNKLSYPGRLDFNSAKGLPMMPQLRGGRSEVRGQVLFPGCAYTKFTGGISMHDLRSNTVIIQPEPTRSDGLAVTFPGYRKAVVSKEYQTKIITKANMIFDAYSVGGGTKTAAAGMDDIGEQQSAVTAV
jgi:hypothetical protein